MGDAVVISNMFFVFSKLALNYYFWFGSARWSGGVGLCRALGIRNVSFLFFLSLRKGIILHSYRM